ncbi:hypothetical protein [Nocardia sp. NPDC057030]|uniref:hypothetical protein n=1 Tax=unclassified Nocardia TaxID=2637762 RepID=UPI0036403101
MSTGGDVGFPLLGPSPYAGAPPGVRRPGVVQLYTRRLDDGTQRVGAVRMDPITMIDPGLLEWARGGFIHSVHVVGDRLVLDLENGHWEYAIGDYDTTHQGFVLRLADGEPLRAGT